MAGPNDALLTQAGDLRTMFALPHWVRRAARLVAVGLLTAAAVLSGRMVGRMDVLSGPDSSQGHRIHKFEVAGIEAEG